MGRSIFKTIFRSSASVFGEIAHYKDGNQVVTQIKGVFERHPVELGDDGRGIQVSGVSPSFSVLCDDLKNPPQEGDELFVRGTQYRVIEIQEGNSGVTAKLILMKAAHE